MCIKDIKKYLLFVLLFLLGVTLFLPSNLNVFPKFLKDPRVFLLFIFLLMQFGFKSIELTRRHFQLSIGVMGLHFLLNRIFSLYSMSPSGFDFSHFDYAIWNASKGFGLDVSIGESYLYYKDLLGNHFAPILYLFVPLYWIFDSHLILPVLQALSLTGALYILGLCSFRFMEHLKLKRPYFLTTFFVSSVGLSKYYLKILSYEFHHEVLYLPVLLLWFYSFSKFYRGEGRGYLVLVSSLLLLCIKEDVAFITAGLGVYLMFLNESKYKKLGLVVLVLSPIYLYFSMKILMPMFYKEGIEKEAATFMGIWGRYGSDFSSVLKGVLTSPLMVLTDIFTGKAFYYIFLPYLFIPLLSPISFAGLIPLSVLLLANGQTRDLLLYYSAPVIPLIPIAFLDGLRNKKLLPYANNIIVISIVLTLALGIGNYRQESLFFKRESYLNSFSKFLDQQKLPKERILVTGHLLPHLPYHRGFKRIIDSGQIFSESFSIVILGKGVNNYPLSDDDFESSLKRLKSETVTLYEDDFIAIFQKE